MTTRRNPARRGLKMGGIPYGEQPVQAHITETLAAVRGKTPAHHLPVEDFELRLFHEQRHGAAGLPIDKVLWLLSRGRKAYGSGELNRDGDRYEILWGGLLKQAQGKGLYGKILRAIRVTEGLPIVSDTDLSDAAVDAWERMFREGGVEWVQESQYSGRYRINPRRPKSIKGRRQLNPGAFPYWFAMQSGPSGYGVLVESPFSRTAERMVSLPSPLSQPGVGWIVLEAEDIDQAYRIARQYFRAIYLGGVGMIDLPLWVRNYRNALAKWESLSSPLMSKLAYKTHRILEAPVLRAPRAVRAGADDDGDD